MPMPVLLRLALFVLLLLPSPAGAQDAGSDGPAILVFDGSGSMWGNIGTEKPPKYELARDALGRALATLSPRVRLGLLSYGHRRRADCSDVEVMAPPEAGPPERIMSLVEKISPKGKGPLALALKQAAEQIPPGEAGSVIVVHDGVDNCWQDMCAAAQDIAKANPKTRVFLAGFGLEKGDAQRLACIARATKGRVLEAQDPAGLEAALSEAFTLANLERVDPSTGIAVPAPKAAPAPKPGGAPGVRLTASLKAGGPEVAAAVQWTLAKADAPAVPVTSVRAPALAADLRPGAYVVEARLGHATARQTVTVGADGPTVAHLSLGAGTLKIDAQADRGGAPLANPVVTVSAKAGGDKGAARPVWIGREAAAELVLPAGTYLVRVQDGLTEETAEVSLAEGTRQEVAPVLGTGRLELSAVEAASGAPLDAVTFTIEEDDPDAPQGRREVARSADPNAAFTLKAGTYYVQARAGSVETNDRIALGSGDVVKHVARLSVVRLTVAAVTDPPAEAGGAAAGERLVVIRIATLDGGKQEVARASGTTGEFRLPPARYMVEALMSGTTIRAAGSVDLTQGRDMKVQIKLEAGEVAVLAGAAAGQHWRIKDDRGRTVMHSGPGEATTARLAPGRYVLLTDGADRRSEQTFELKAGARHELRIGSP